MFENGEQGPYQQRIRARSIIDSPAWHRLLEQIKRVAPTDANVLIEGETRYLVRR